MYIQTIKARVSGVRSEFKDGIWQGIKAEDEATFEDRQILYPESGYELEKNGERFSCVWLKDGDTIDNYTEKELPPEPEEEPEENIDSVNLHKV